MSILTGRYINGQWTTHQVDVQHVLAQNRQNDSHENTMAGPDTPQRPPVVGILTQKLSESPVIKWIIPARIRHESKNDVLFIYDTYIQIKEVGDVLNEGAMRTVAVKADFDSSIRSARIFGLPRKYTNPLPEGQDAIVKIEEMEDVEPSVPLRPEIPPHILVMALESNWLVFLTSFHNNDGQVQFLSYKRALPAQESVSEQLGQHIAVDPKSRAMAVAALEGSLTIYGLKTMADIKRETEVDGEICSEKFMPVKEEKHILVDGLILNMEFLHPSEGDDDHVVLLVIVSRNRQSRLICYEWNCQNRLETAQPKGNSQRIHSDDQLPLLLVPLKKSTAFMLVYENRITVYRNILTGNATSHALSLHQLEQPEEPGSSKRLPIWTHWARPSRHDLHVQRQDNIYLCREDGVVHFLEIKDNVAQMLDCTHRVGILGVDVNTSFASIDLGARGCDLLVIGGNMCNGGGWLFEPCEPVNKIFSLPNWTPLIDFIGDNTRGVGGNMSRMALISKTGQNHQRLFASTGRGSRHGTITEIRYGIEAFKNIGIELSHSGVTQIWSLEWAQNNNPSLLILLSYPTTTALVIIDAEGISHNQRGEKESKIDYDVKTIAAAATKTGLIIQVTNMSIRVVSPSLQTMLFYQEENIMTACLEVIENGDTIAILLTAIQKQNEMYLHLGRLALESQQIVYHAIGEPVPLLYELSFISIEIIQEELVVFVGAINSTIQAYHSNPKSGLTPIFEHRFEGQVAICDSIAVLTVKTEMTFRYVLVCGLRNGFVEVLFLNPKPSGDNCLAFREKLHIGNTSVTVKIDKMKASRAIVLCEQKLYTLEYPLDISPESQVPAILQSIWLTDSEFQSFQQGKIDSLTQTCLSFARGWLLCVEQNQIHIATLSSEPSPTIIPRYLPFEGTPTRVIYSVRLKKLIVLYYKISINARIPTNGHQVRVNQRRVEYMIAVIDPDVDANNIKLEPDNGGDEENKSPAIIPGKPGERFLGIIEWYPEGNNEVHHMLVVNTMVEHLPPRQPTGRVLFFSVSVVGALTLKKTIDKDAPVYSLASYGLSSLIYCYGTEMCLHNLEITSKGKKWQDPIIMPLRTRGLYLSIHQNFVYVTTSEFGLAIFKVEDNKLIHQFDDGRARDDMFHLTLPEQSLVLTSQKTRTITGLWQPSEKITKKVTPAIFEARLPGSVTRFRRISRPLWQQSLDSESPSEAIIGSTTDGSMFQFEILHESSWRLLAFIQNMAFRNPAICPYGNFVQAHRKLLDPSPANPLNMHVNGDILHRLIAQGSERTLLAMLGKEHILEILLNHHPILMIMLSQHPRRGPISDHKYMEREEVAAEIASREAEARQSQIIELAGEVGLTGKDGLELVQKVVEWMRHKLQRAL